MLNLSKFLVFINIFGLLLFYSEPIFAQEQQSTPSGEKYSFSLKQSIDYALKHQATILDATLDQSISQQQVRGATARGLPQINGSVELDDYLAKPVSIIPGAFFAAFSGHPSPDVAVSFLLQYQATAGVSASQMLFDGSFFIGLEAAKAYVNLARKNVKSSEIDVVANVTKAYYAVIVNEKSLASLDANIALLQKTLDETKARNIQGLREKLDVDRIAVNLSNLQVSRQNQRSSVDLYYYLLKATMEMPINASLVLTDSLPSSFPSPSLEKVEYAKRIEYSMLESRLQLQDFDLRRNRAGYLPTLSAFGNLSAVAYRDQFNFFDTKEQWYPTGLVGIKLNVPIFDGFQKDANIQISKMTLQKLQNDKLSLENVIDLQVKQFGIVYENSYKNLMTQKENLRVAEDVVRVSKIKYEEGVGTNIEVVNDQNALQTTQYNYFNALYNAAVSLVDLQKAKGTLY
jgi:outer membrane protein